MPARSTEPPHAETFVHRQTLANVMRFSTLELAELEARIATAADRALALELDIFATLPSACSPSRSPLAARAPVSPSSITMPASPSSPIEQNYVRPKVDESLVFAIEEGRHPMVEQTLARGDGASFVGNDCRLGRRGEDAGTRILVVTGPNMAGKSTFLRQNALIVVLAQIGLLRSGHSRRISASSTGCSAASAPPTISPAAARPSWSRWSRPRRSSIRRRCAPSSSSTRSAAAPRPSTASPSPGRRSNICTRSTARRVLFATHYHELTALAERLPRAANVTVEVKEWRDEIVFLYRVVPGAADRSYGIHVAKLAGLPAPVLARASEVLSAAGKGRRQAEAVRSCRRPAAVQRRQGRAAPQAARGLAARGHGRRARARRHDPARGA